jgi:diacylglycerol kinase family enzyme
MRVILFHNQSAGTSDHSAAALIDEIARAGHELIAHVSRRADLAAALGRGCDLVAVAGGDGTVGKAAKVLRGTGVPLTVLPRGTANNIARVLGSDGVAWWDRGQVRPYDVALARIDGGWKRFIEALGFGAFARVVDQSIADGDTADRLGRDRALLRARLEVSPLKRYRITADGDDLSGEYFLVEVVNIAAIGPRLCLAPAASPSDGKLDLVLAGKADRAPLLDALDGVMRGGAAAMPLPTRQAARIAIDGTMRRYHRDGDMYNRRTAAVDVSVEPAALRVLVPPP